MTKHWWTILACIVCGATILHADDADTNKRFRFGATLGATLNFHAASFGSLAGFPSCCPEYTSGSGVAPALGLLAEIPLSSSVSHIIRASLSDLGADLGAAETTPVIVNNQVVTARIQHSLTAIIKGIAVEPDVYFRLGRSIGLYTGLRCDFSLKGEISQKEELVYPLVGTFENGKRIRNEQDGVIFALQPIVASAVGGIRWELPMNKDASLLLIPELSLSFGLNTITASEQWRVHTLRLATSIVFQSPKPFTTVTPWVDNTPLGVELSAFPFDGTHENPNGIMSVEESERIDFQPLLPCVFFDFESDVLPARYTTVTDTDIDSFRVSDASKPTALSTYYNILPIIGRRLRQHSRDSISIIGRIDPAESNAVEHAKKRADQLAFYFRRIWGIDRTRIHLSVEAADTLFNEANAALQGAQNRRVDFKASERILSPVQFRDTLRQVSPRFIRIRPQAKGGAAVDQWDISVYQKSTKLKTFNGSGSLPFKFTADVMENPFVVINDSLRVMALVSSKDGSAASAAVALPTSVLSLGRKRQEGLSDTLTIRTQLLQLRSSLMSPSRQLQMQSVTALYNQRSSLNLVDYSDTTTEGAKNVLQELKLSGSSVNVSAAASPHYSNMFPESRAYNHSVDIIVHSVQ